MKIGFLLEFEDRARDFLRDSLIGKFLVLNEIAAKSIYSFMGKRGDIVIRDLGDHRIAVDPSDTTIAFSILRHGAWQREDFTAAQDFLAGRGQLRPGGTFVDIGANIGSQTIYAMLSGHHARALAVEPVPANAKLLRMNMMLNGLEDRVGTVESPPAAPMEASCCR